MLKDIDFFPVYASEEIEPLEFFIDGLLNSNKFDLGLGFFSSSGFNALAVGFAPFIKRGGEIRIIINDTLSSKDKRAIIEGVTKKPEELLEAEIIEDIVKLYESLSSNGFHFFKCLSWLIATNRLKIKATTPIANSVGIVHQKFGLFSDDFNNTVTFSGSINFSKTAFLNNIEAISCNLSWVNESREVQKVEYYNELFKKTWEGKSQIVKIIPIEKVKEVIRDKFPVRGINELLIEEEKLINELMRNKISKSVKKKLDFVKNKYIVGTSDLPKYPDEYEKREYQNDAVNSWVNNSYQGLFEMATGTGKTVTGLLASTYLIERIDKIFLLILVPTISLAEQWKKEVERFNYRESYIISSDYPNWPVDLQQTLNSFKLTNAKYPVFISTYDSFKSKKFQDVVNQLPPQTMLIADEAHTMGAAEIRKKTPHNIKYRLGLSATPHRHYDDSGTQSLLRYFSAESRSTYSFDMERAISEKFLCQYKLYPHFVELTKEEYRQYIDISRQISRKAHINRQKFIDTDKGLEKLLRDRRNILNKAFEKINALSRIIDDMKTKGEVHHTLVYCPEGMDNDEDQRIIDQFGRLLGFEKGLRIGKFVGDTPTDIRRQLLDDFDKGKIQCLLAMKCLDEGVDVKRTETAIFISSTTNPRQYIQRRGRVLRTHPKKPFAYLHDIIVKPPVLQNEDERVIQVERTILRQEFRRFKEFAEDALNYAEAMAPINNLCEEFKIDL